MSMPPLADTPAAIPWLPWGAAAFARARDARKPVLLWICTTWSHGCREMERVSFGDPIVAADIAERFVAVRVDADERPDIADRYELGGVPTTAFLDGHGALLGGGTFVPPHRLRTAMSRVVQAFDRLGASTAAGCDRDPPDAETDPERLRAGVFDHFDRQYADSAPGPAFPLAAPVRLALDVHRESHDDAMLQRATRALDVMGWGALWDHDDGGFFRCCNGPGWSNPQREKLLVTNAVLLDLYLHAGERTKTARWLSRASSVVAFLNERLRRRDDCWRMSPDGESGRVFSDANAVTVAAMLHAAREFGDEALGTQALKSLESVLLSTYRPGEGVAHCAGGIRGLLTDQVAMAAASLDAFEATGNVAYRMMAEELMRYALSGLWDADRGGFFDRMETTSAGEPGAGTRRKPFVLNCEAAVVLRRLADSTGDDGLGATAAATLCAISGAASAQGVLGAHLLLARRAVLR